MTRASPRNSALRRVKIDHLLPRRTLWLQTGGGRYLEPVPANDRRAKPNDFL